jgi:hypothetical protein
MLGERATFPSPFSFNPLTPFWTIVTILFEAGFLGGGSFIVFTKVIPYLSAREGLHPITPEERERFQHDRIMRFMFGNAKKYFDYPFSFIGSYAMKGAAFILLIGVLGLLLTSVGWVSPLTWQGLEYDLILARSNGQPNGAHLFSYTLIPVLGLYVAMKYREKGDLPNSYLGLLVCALGVAIHESIWITAYYFQYWTFLDWGLFDNILKDVFFFSMLLVFFYIYVKFPFQKIPIRTFLWPTVIYTVFILYWLAIGLPITIINNFNLGQGVFMQTTLWADPFTNALEVFSWVLLYALMFLAVWRLEKNIPD